MYPGSGFQSLQFRLIEIKLGVRKEDRWLTLLSLLFTSFHGRCLARVRPNFEEAFEADWQRSALRKTTEEASLRSEVETWLERTPGVGDERWWAALSTRVGEYLADQRVELRGNYEDAEGEYARLRTNFAWLLGEVTERAETGLSERAQRGALLVNWYRTEPRVQGAYQVLSQLMDVDCGLTRWRQNHALLVQRMLGVRGGTGGSSGYQYLRSTISDRSKPFKDLFLISTWLLPKAYLPPPPQDLLQPSP